MRSFKGIAFNGSASGLPLDNKFESFLVRKIRESPP